MAGRGYGEWRQNFARVAPAVYVFHILGGLTASFVTISGIEGRRTFTHKTTAPLPQEVRKDEPRPSRSPTPAPPPVARAAARRGGGPDRGAVRHGRARCRAGHVRAGDQFRIQSGQPGRTATRRPGFPPARRRRWWHCTAARRMPPTTTTIPAGRSTPTCGTSRSCSRSSSRPTTRRIVDWYTPSDSPLRRRRRGGVDHPDGAVCGSTYGVNPSRIYITGLSAGGGMTDDMLASYPDVFACGSIDSGLPADCATSLTNAYTCEYDSLNDTPAQSGALAKNADPSYSGPYPRIAIWQGTADTTVAPLTRLRRWTRRTDLLGNQPDGLRHPEPDRRHHRRYLQRLERQPGGGDLLDLGHEPRARG